MSDIKKQLEKLKEFDVEGLIKEIRLFNDGSFEISFVNENVIHSSLSKKGIYILEYYIGETQEDIQIVSLDDLSKLLDVYNDISRFIEFAISILEEYDKADFHDIIYHSDTKTFSIEIETYDFFITMLFDLSLNLLNFNITSIDCERIENEKRKEKKELKEIITKMKEKFNTSRGTNGQSPHA